MKKIGAFVELPTETVSRNGAALILHWKASQACAIKAAVFSLTFSSLHTVSSL